MDPLAQVVNLPTDVVTLALKRLQMSKLLLDFGLFVAGRGVALIAIVDCTAGFHHR